MSIKQAFLNHKNELKKMHIEELGIDVFVSKWSGADRARILPQVLGIDNLEESKKYKEMFNGMAKIVQETLKNEDGTRVFADTKEDFETIINFDGQIIQEIFDEIMIHNGVGEKEIVEAAKN